MIQHYIATFLLFGWISIAIMWWIFSFNLIIIWYVMIIIFPFFLNEEYEMKVWGKEYLSK